MRGENLRQRVKKDFDDVCLQLRGGVKHQKSFSNTKMNDRERERERVKKTPKSHITMEQRERKRDGKIER